MKGATLNSRFLLVLLVAVSAASPVTVLAQPSRSNSLQLRNQGGTVILRATTSGSVTLSLPSSAGSNGQVLATNGSGTLSWTNAATAINGLSDGFKSSFDFGTNLGGDMFLGGKPTLNASDRLTAVGVGALGSIGAGHAASSNTAVGFNAGNMLTIQDQNTAIGATSQHDAEGNQNTTVGYETGFTLTATAEGNVALGVRNYRNQTTGDDNIAIGRDAFYTGGIGSYNIAIGSAAWSGNANAGAPPFLSPNTGDLNIAIGRSVGTLATTAAHNVIVGSDAASSLTEGNNNTLIGKGAGSALTTGTGNIMIGFEAGGLSAAAISNKLYIHNSSTVTPLIEGDFDSNSPTPAPSLTINGDFAVAAGKKFRVSNLAPPAAANDPGQAGEIRYGMDAGVHYIYVCVAADTWVRTALATW